jgi:hypothetical protein
MGGTLDSAALYPMQWVRIPRVDNRIYDRCQDALPCWGRHLSKLLNLEV